ncbi:MAG TPA: hypothetical protein VLB44_10335 [Kofleriaceae bacterium]|nr:hypothetical protein [Kofleriaceae bacterium]
MRAIFSAVVLPSLLIAATAGAQPKTGATGGTTATKGSTSAGTTTAAKGGATGSAGATSPAATPTGTTPTGTTPTGTGTTPAGTPPAGAGAGSGSGEAAPTDLSSVKPEDMPSAVRMRRLEQKTQALKERAWQLKARLEMLKEQTLGGGVGAQALIAHADQMGSSFRLIKLVYSLDGTQVFARTDDEGESLYKTKSFDVFAGPISPGNHNLQVVASYRGHGYGVFEYLSKFTFTARGNASFTTGEGKISKVECRGFEKGGAGTPMEKRPAIDCKVTEGQPEKADKAAPAATPGTTPLPPPAAGTTSTPPGK